MANRIIGGPLIKEMDRDEEGHRTYKIKFRVESDSVLAGKAAGPQSIYRTPGLPIPGDLWDFDIDSDPFAYCLPNVVVRSETPNVPSKMWTCEYTFTTKPIKRKIDNEQQDPLLEPNKTSGTFVKFTEEKVFDWHGKRITTSSHELIRGPQNEWDMSRHSVKVEQMVGILGLSTFEPMLDTLNDRALWGLPARYWKLSNVVWQELFYRFTSIFKRTLEFEAWSRKKDDGTTVSGWDRDILDEGTKVLRGKWTNIGTATAPIWSYGKIGNPDPGNPADFIRFQDPNYNMTRVILDGAGMPYVPNLSNLTLTCGQCPAGSPTKWEVRGFQSVAGGPGYSQYNGTEITNTGGCTWTGFTLDRAATITLSYTAPTWSLTIVGLGLDQLYQKAGTLWNCLSGNTLTQISGNATDPPSMTLIPVGSNKPGNIHVEGYGESNFLLLGIPPVLGP